MSKVNFVSEFNLFMRYARDNSLSLRERMLWLALFYIANDRAIYNERTQEYNWPDDYIQVSNNELNLYCCLDKRAVDTLRNTLKQRGLIDFMPGQKNKRHPAYKINYLSVNVGYKIVPNPTTNHTTNDDTNNDPYPAPYPTTSGVPSLSPLSKYNINNTADTGLKDLFAEEEEDEEDQSARAYMRMRELVNQTYKTSFGEAPTLAELETMARIISARKLEQVADKAVEETAKAAPKNRLAYLTALCADWEEQYIRTPSDLADYKVLRDMGETIYPNSAELAMARIDARMERKKKYTQLEASA